MWLSPGYKRNVTLRPAQEDFEYTVQYHHYRYWDMDTTSTVDIDTFSARQVEHSAAGTIAAGVEGHIEIDMRVGGAVTIKVTGGGTFDNTPTYVDTYMDGDPLVIADPFGTIQGMTPMKAARKVRWEVLCNGYSQSTAGGDRVDCTAATSLWIDAHLDCGTGIVTGAGGQFTWLQDVNTPNTTKPLVRGYLYIPEDQKCILPSSPT
jgi:hypothetical protein